MLANLALRALPEAVGPQRSAILPGMDLAGLRRHCLSLPGVAEGRPYGPTVLVMKVHGKVFAIIGDQAAPLTVSLKCEPDLAAALRSTYAAVVPGYHLNKRHWNTVALDGEVPADEVMSWVEDSYDLVVDGLPKAVRSRLRGC